MGYEDSVYLAKLAEQAERYEGQYLKHLCVMHQRLINQQRWWRI